MPIQFTNILFYHLQKLYSTNQFGNKYADFVMIVASLCKVKLTEEIVEKGSDTDKDLMKRANCGTYPILEID